MGRDTRGSKDDMVFDEGVIPKVPQFRWGTMIDGLVSFVQLALIVSAIAVDNYASIDIGSGNVYLNLIPDDSEHTGSESSYNATRITFYFFLSLMAAFNMVAVSCIISDASGYVFSQPVYKFVHARGVLYTTAVLSIIVICLLFSLVRYSVANINGATISYASPVSTYRASANVIMALTGISVGTPIMTFLSETMHKNKYRKFN